MKNTSAGLIAAGVAVVVVLLGFTFFAPQAEVTPGVPNELPIGSQSVSVTEGNCYSLMGVNVCPNRIKMNTATTTVCAIKSPAATSTLVRASAAFTISSSTASTITLAKATTAFATTTLLNNETIGAGAQGTVTATSTAFTENGLDGLRTFAPNTYFVVGMAGNVGTFSPTGFCNATFETL